MPEILFFPYFGPNRRSDKRVVEVHLNFASDYDFGFPKQVSDIQLLLADAGVLDESEPFPQQPPPDDRISWYASLLVQTALLFQQKADHRVDFSSVLPETKDKRRIALMEHEHTEVGMAAIKLACQVLTGNQDSLASKFKSFCAFARDRLLPIETEAIINSARRHGIPLFQLEREPLTGHLDTGYRVRANSLLLLGHGSEQHLLDGTFCVDKAGNYLRALLRNPDQRKSLLQQLGIPIAPDKAKCELGNRLYQLLVINGKVTTIAVMDDCSKQIEKHVHSSLVESALAISEKAGGSPINLILQTEDITRALLSTGGAALDFELAPDLHQVFDQCPDGVALIKSAADDLIMWLYPDQDSARIPIVAVTGTNGKTTTSRMISHILREGGYKPGLVCTDGIYQDQKQISHEDGSAFIGHARILTNKRVDAAVLESHHRGIAVRGFAFNECDIGVCLNVTNDHLQNGSIETVEEMAEIKRALLERASHAAVLFADNQHCMAMLDFITAKNTCLVSLDAGVEQLRSLGGPGATCFCVLEELENREWIVLYNKQLRLPVMPVSDIPATFDGTARFNVSNAMHAIVAAYFAGVGTDSIKLALCKFKAGRELTPGRMNVFDNFPFRVVMDYAHNADGFRKITEFVDKQVVAGQKILMFGYSGDRLDANIKAAATQMAGHFDHYVCRNFRVPRDRKPHEIPALLKSGLRSAGVVESDISVVLDADEAVRYSLSMAESGDLVVLLVGSLEFQSVWDLLAGIKPHNIPGR